MKPWIVVSQTEPRIMEADGAMRGHRRWLIASGVVSVGGVSLADIPIIEQYGLFGRCDNDTIAIRPDLKIDDFIWQKANV